MTRMLSPARIAALALLGLGIVGLVAGDPYHRSTATVDTRELAAIVEREIDHVTAPELADWIIQGRADFRLIDLRSEEEYAAYRIPGAERVPITALMDHGLMRNETIVLYSGGGIHSAQAWMLLKAHDYRGVTMLLGGLDAWKDEVLFPAIDAGSPAFDRAAHVARFFGGTPRQASATELAGAPMPAPPPPAAAPATARPKKRKEGC